MGVVDSVLWDIRLDIDAIYRLDGANNWLSASQPEESRGDRTFRLLCLVGGHCWCGEQSRCDRPLDPGDLLVSLGAGGLRLYSSPDNQALSRRVRPSDDPCRQRIGDPAVSALGVIGALGLGGNFSHPLISGLPECFVVHCSDISSDGARGHPGFMIDQLLSGNDDDQGATIGRLFEVLAIKAIKAHYRSVGSDYRFMHALHDPEVGAAIAAMHRAPGFNWTLERLAGQAGLSRSAFCQRFAELTGVPAMRYLTTWRMHIALGQLRVGGGDLEKIARGIGYRSPTAFHKAFKRVHGLTPAKAAAS